jgi:UDPglucose 6-dehydrogenase
MEKQITHQVGVIGQGFVGGSLSNGLAIKADNIGKSNLINIRTYDKFSDEKSTDTLEDLVNFSSIIFVCVPTPMKKTGQCDTSIVESVLSDINLCLDSHDEKVVVIKSTIPPGSTDDLNITYGRKNLTIVFNPEFLTEANALNDFIGQDRIILGGEPKAIEKVSDMFLEFFDCNIVKTDSKNAELVKYVTNCFLSCKLSFFNEIYQIADGLGIDYEELINNVTLDKRINIAHTKIPGPDGSFGWGGHCFPKDVNALIFSSDQNSIDTTMLRATWEKNLIVRQPEFRDWENMPGRAISIEGDEND